MCAVNWFHVGLSNSIRALYGVCVSLVAVSSFSATSQAAFVPPSDVAVLIQKGHYTRPKYFIAHHTEKYSFLEILGGSDRRLWRRADDTEPWQLFRHWQGRNSSWSHRLDGKLTYAAMYVDGMFELYDAQSYELLYRVSARMPQGTAASKVYVISGETGRVTIIRLRELDSHGEKFYSLHLAVPGSGFDAWRPLGETARITGFSELEDGLFAFRTEKNNPWQLVRVDASGKARSVQLPGFPTRLANVRRLQRGLIGVAVYGDADLDEEDDDGASWHLFRITPVGELTPVRVPGLEPSDIKNVKAVSNSESYIRLVERGPENDAALLTRFYRVDEQNRLMLVHQAIPALPEAMRNFRVLARDRVVGATEVDDANDNGIPGDWTWRLQDTQSNWRPPQDVLPGLKGEKIWRIVDWLDGEGLGVQTMDPLYRWYWYLLDGTGGWQAIDQILPLPQNLNIDSVQDRQDNLSAEGTYIKLVAAPDKPPSADPESPVPVAKQNVHYIVRDEDGEWTSVRNLVEGHHPGWENHIIAVNALRNGLKVDLLLNDNEPPVHLYFYKRRDGRWVPLDNEFVAVAGLTAQEVRVRPFPRVKHSEVLANGRLALLHEQRDANWDGQVNDTQLLQAEDGVWRILHTRNALGGEAKGSSYHPELGLLVRKTSAIDEKTFFWPDVTGNWKDVRSIVPEAPARIDSAFVFADGRGLSVKERLDSNGNGQFGERLFYYHDNEVWQDIRKKLPNTFPLIQTIVGGGGRSSISVQEAGYANANQQANEWKHYYRRGDTWIDLRQQLPDLPDQLSELQVSEDGRVLTIREEWDSNWNDLPFELFAGIWSDVQQDFVPLGSVIAGRASGTGSMVAIQSLWNGRGIGINLAMGVSTEAGVAVREDSTWHLYHHQDGDQWQEIEIDAGNLEEVRSDTSGRLLALRRQNSDRWELWTRNDFGTDFVRWRNDQLSSSSLDSLKDVRFNAAVGIVALKTHDLWIDTDERWEIWQQDNNGLSLIGHSATPSWFGFNHRGLSKKLIRFDDSSHYVDGRPADGVPKPVIWFHDKRNIPDDENILYSPDIVSRSLAGPEGTDLPIRIDALGYGPQGTVVVYHSNTRRFVVSFSGGPVWIESRPLLNESTDTRSGDLMLLVNRFSDGTERLVRLDAPDRWIWSYSHRGGRIYYDDSGYFYNETNAASEVLTFRVGLEVHSFAQLSSYLFRPDLLEKRLGLPERSMFAITERDADRIELARKLAPEGVDISSLQPPHINVLESATITDKPFVYLNISAEGFGINEDSISIRILGAGKPRMAPRRSQGVTWQRLSTSKRVPLLAGKNRLEIAVVDANGLSHSQHLDITSKPDEERKPTLYLAVIATAEYQDRNLAKLPLTQNDARDIAAIFDQQKGKRFNKVVLRTWCQSDHCSFQPTRQNLVKGLPNFLRDAQNGDYIVVYVSGHGLKIGNEYYMVPEDGYTDVPSTLVAWSTIWDWLSSASLGKKIVLLDTCHSGAVFQGLDRRHWVQQAADEGIYVLSAAAADAAAYESNNLGNGVFTYVIQKGLEGQADTRHGAGVIFFEELAYYVARDVRRLSTAMNIRMEPDVPILDQHMDFPVADVYSRKQLILSVRDESSFDLNPQTGRVAWWQGYIERLHSDIFVISTEQPGGYMLMIVEKDGEPSRSRLSISHSKKVLGDWQFSEMSVEDMLQAMAVKLSTHHQASVACNSKSATSLLECEE